MSRHRGQQREPSGAARPSPPPAPPGSPRPATPTAPAAGPPPPRRQRQQPHQLLPQRPGPRGEPRPPRPGRRRRHPPPAPPGHRRARPRRHPARRRGLRRQHQHRHDHRGPVTPPRPQIRGQQHMRPPAPPAPAPPRPEPLQPPGIATSRRPGMTPRPQHPAARAAQHPGQQPRLDTLRRTSYRYHQVPPPAPSGGLPRSHGQEITGRAAATAYMATVTPSTTPRLANPPNLPERHR